MSSFPAFPGPQVVLKPHRCPGCGKTYKRKAHLLRHLKFECGQAPRFSCIYCSHKSKLKDNLKKHMYNQHLEETLKNGFNITTPTTLLGYSGSAASYFFCTGCNKRYKHKSHLKRHLKYECGKEPQFACPHCPYRAKLKHALKSHMSHRHLGFNNNLLAKVKISNGQARHKDKTNYFACQNCDKSYKRKWHLKRHVDFECGKEPTFQCPNCPYRAKLKDSLKTHLVLKHFYSPGVDPAHREASQDEPFCDDHLKKPVPGVFPLLIFIFYFVDKLNKRFTCSKCFTSYKHKHTLTKHVKYECGIEKQFGCQFCPFKSKRKHNVKTHAIRIHSLLLG
ncbi:gastrula zinc finger protein XlCGF57.1-like [Cimex lectularius]|uniref:C2H2-type domain-containing protein n=1 Tax=Cimex lectularius TaxID=79782 RepID=A0A8I6SRU9_CIMLE|nr:gastrula zinc finger protein XlCGF57.1-like [Cimex lectularius]